MGFAELIADFEGSEDLEDSGDFEGFVYSEDTEGSVDVGNFVGFGSSVGFVLVPVDIDYYILESVVVDYCIEIADPFVLVNCNLMKIIFSN